MAESPLLCVADVSKSFGSLLALGGVSIDFHAGEIHAVLGANGAGKSTLMAVLAGFLQPDSGTVTLADAPLPLGQPFAIKHRGVRMVHQHFMLVPNFTVEENLALADLEQPFRPLDVKAETATALATADRLGWKFDPKARTGDLPVGTQQRIEITKALAGEAKVLILDEPTAVLGDREVDELFAVLREVACQGTAVIIIAHNLDEVTRIADRVSVLRHGRMVASFESGEIQRDRLREVMQGEDAVRELRPPTHQGPDRVHVQDITVRGDRGEIAVDGLSLDVAEGEIFGIAGVDGNGQTELAEALVGLRPLDSGQIVGVSHPGYVPQDRQTDGLALGLTVEENLLLGNEARPDFRRGPLLRVGAIRAWAQDLVARYSVKVGRVTDPVGSLSGGNQQKIIVARAMSSQPDTVVACNPTRGLDIVATNFVRGQLTDLADGGGSVIVSSTDREDLELALEVRTISRGRWQVDEVPQP